MDDVYVNRIKGLTDIKVQGRVREDDGLTDDVYDGFTVTERFRNVEDFWWAIIAVVAGFSITIIVRRIVRRWHGGVRLGDIAAEIVAIGSVNIWIAGHVEDRLILTVGEKVSIMDGVPKVPVNVLNGVRGIQVDVSEILWHIVSIDKETI